MSVTLEALRAALAQACAGMVPQAEALEAPDFVPNLDLQRGSLSCDITLRLAAQLKLAPADVGARLLAALPADFRPYLQICNGYLSVPAEILLPHDPAAIRLTDRIAICVAPAADRRQRVGVLRCLAAAILQRSILSALGASVELYLGPERLAGAKSFEPLPIWNAGLALLERPALPVALAQLQDLAPESQRVWFWLVNGMFAHGEFMALVQRAAARSRFKVAESIWGEPVPDDFFGCRPEVTSAEQTAALLCYLCGAQPAIELDPGCYLLHERANLIWDLWATRQRLSRFVRVPVTAADASAPAQDLTADLCSDLHYLPLALIQAGQHARVVEFIELLRRLLRQLNSRFNSPQFRQRADRADLSKSDRYILTGAQRVISFIISGCSIIGESGGQDTGT